MLIIRVRDNEKSRWKRNVKQQQQQQQQQQQKQGQEKARGNRSYS